jgi:hypothetical protein
VPERAASPFVLAAALLSVVGLSFGEVGCGRVLEPANKPIDTCVKSCVERASRSCSEGECSRGCEFILDRIVEKESDNVLACVARTPRRCGDIVWADCAAQVGIHADGGPPAPPPPQDDD